MESFESRMKSVIALHANSLMLQEELEKINKCYYVPNGVDEKMFKFVRRDIGQEFKAGYVGKPATNPLKGLGVIIFPACEIAGVKLKVQAVKYNFPDKIPHEEMPKWYEDVDVILCASIMDGTPNSMLEAACVGRTFIANRIGNVPQFVNQGVNGFMVERSINAYVEKLLFLKENRHQCRYMGVMARNTVEKNWTWELQAENYRRMFKELLK